jgi:hypothetical protein
VVVRQCSDTSDTLCGSASNCMLNQTTTVEYAWLDNVKCKAGMYMWGYSSSAGQTCRACPLGWAGLNGKYCERCKPLEEPYYLDRASCVCKPPAVMNAEGECVCPSGYNQDNTSGLLGECKQCKRNTYGIDGQCFPCGAGKYTRESGAVECQTCGFGQYRLEGQAECQSCAVDEGWYAPDPSSSACVKCNTSCASTPGWRKQRDCPSGTGEICEPCPGGGLTANAMWAPLESAELFLSCAFKCMEGYFHRQGQCVACSNITMCEDLSYKMTPCSAQADSHCEVPCLNDTKAAFNSKWLPGCQWGCEDGYEVAVGDYWMFVLYECRPSMAA